MAHDIIKTIDLESNPVLHLHQTTENYDDPLQHFTYALSAPETKRQYPKRLKMFMDFVKIEGNLKQQSKRLKEKIKEEPEWLLTNTKYSNHKKDPDNNLRTIVSHFNFPINRIVILLLFSISI